MTGDQRAVAGRIAACIGRRAVGSRSSDKPSRWGPSRQRACSWEAWREAAAFQVVPAEEEDGCWAAPRGSRRH